MRFNIYGRFQVEIRREQDGWVVYRAEPGKRAKFDELVVPPELDADELATYLDDIFHELAGPGQSVVLMDA